eukprot:16449006-Heterocapsa_arctica.AAC.1
MGDYRQSLRRLRSSSGSLAAQPSHTVPGPQCIVGRIPRPSPEAMHRLIGFPASPRRLRHSG